jgi:hypothetical protein
VPADGSDPAVADGWGTPTAFGATIPSPAAIGASGWPRDVGLAAAWLLLVATPVGLLASVLRGRVRRPRIAWTGRNRRGGDSVGPVANPRLVAIAALCAASVVAVFASGMEGEVRYLRLVLAVGAGLALLNLAVVIAARVAARAMGVVSGIRLVPAFLVVGVLTAIASRVFDLHPPVVIGVILGAGVVVDVAGEIGADVGARARATVQLAQVGALALVASAGWALHGVLGSVDGFWGSAVSEGAAAMCLAGFGSALLLLLPVGGLPGRAILGWSLPVWAGTTFVVALLAVTVLVSDGFPVLWAVLVAAAASAFAFSAWAWVRFVEPSRA